MRSTLAPDDDLAALVRATPAGVSLVMVVLPGRDPLALASVRAAIGPLAIERAPAARLNAVLPDPAADPAAIAAAVAWLEGALSTTGQLIEVSAASACTPPATR